MPPRHASGRAAAVSTTNPPDAATPIRVQGLVKRFGRFTALDGLDLEVAAGQVHGFLGPNGAGKSTTIRTLLGLYHPDGGAVRVLGRDPRREAPQINREVSYVAGDVALWPNLTGGQALDALAGLRGRRDRALEDELIERFALDPSKKVRTYSKGNRQKVALVAALAAPTSLLILDEPTSGLDPLMEQVFMDEVTRAAAQGRTVLLSSHVLAEVQRLCSAVTIIKDGRVVEQGDLSRLQQLARTQIEVRGGADLLRRIAASLPQLKDDLSVKDGRLSVQVGAAQVPAVLAAVAAQGATDVICRPASLEDLFLRHYEEVRG
ncbi:MAG: ABC transporter ATP-binding protein [Actinomyces succiniciruminis]|nr:ABC transporter ATP-binding protein [Actinomyces succiniciruminis]